MSEELNALVVSDLQIPFEHPDALIFSLAVKEKFFKGRRALNINIGDEVDQHTLGKWAKDPNGMSAGFEFEASKDRLKAWAKEYPKTYVCISNHTYRVFKTAKNAGIPSQFLRTIGEAYDLPGTWQWRDRWVFGNVVFEHGENVSGKAAALMAAEQNRMSTVIGHQHSFGGVVHSATFNSQIYGMNVGCLIDIEAYAFHYGVNYRKKPTLGLGVIVGGIPLFVPMQLKANKRCNGKVL
jgi:hypothetical protein